MVDRRVRVKRTAPDVLVSNLRGEVGEAITTWILLRHYIQVAQSLQTDDLSADMENQELSILYILRGKLQDDLIAKLSELADAKIGRTNFYFAAQKLGALEEDVRRFERYIVKNKLREKRNHEIAHREQPETWPVMGPLRIPYPVLVRATGMAVRLMKRVDRLHLGPTALRQWQIMRKQRYDFSGPPRAMYLLLPHMIGASSDSLVEGVSDVVNP